MQSGPKVPKQPRIKNHYKTTVNVYSARTFCTSVRGFPWIIFEKTSMSPDRVQSITCWDDIFDFHLGFAEGFGSITKPQREAQLCQPECSIRTLSWFL